MVKVENIILITVDCLRADFVGCLGSECNLTPNIDEFSRKGVLFTQAIVNGPSTPFSFPSIFASTYPLVDPNFPKLSRFRITLAEILKRSNFKTAGFNSNPYLSKYYNYDIGFTFFDDIFSENKELKQKGLKGLIKKYRKLFSFLKKLYKRIRIKYKIKPPYQCAEKINKKALSWLKTNKGKKFVWMHYMDSHHPFLPPKKYRTTNNHKMYKAEKILKKNPPNVSQKNLTNIKSQYKATIKYLDNKLGDFFVELRTLDLLDNTLIIITADHGEEFKEHGDFSHNSKLYEELIHVPLIIVGPNLPSNVIIEDLVSLIDLAPTIIDYLTLSKIEDFMGISFIPLIRRQKENTYREGVFSESLIKEGKVCLSYKEGFRLISYRTKNWKLIINEEQNTKELYNLIIDPLEKNNLYYQKLELARNYERKISNHIELEKKIKKELIERNKLARITRTIALN
ncbi:MAG: sulfatase [Promethearchaeota archaeon]